MARASRFPGRTPLQPGRTRQTAVTCAPSCSCLPGRGAPPLLPGPSGRSKVCLKTNYREIHLRDARHRIILAHVAHDASGAIRTVKSQSADHSHTRAAADARGAGEDRPRVAVTPTRRVTRRVCPSLPEGTQSQGLYGRSTCEIVLASCITTARGTGLSQFAFRLQLGDCRHPLLLHRGVLPDCSAASYRAGASVSPRALVGHSDFFRAL